MSISASLSKQDRKLGASSSGAARLVIVRSCGHAIPSPGRRAAVGSVGEFADEVRQIFAELGRGYGLDTLAGECSPPSTSTRPTTRSKSRWICPVSTRGGPRRRQGHGGPDCRREGAAPRPWRFELSPRRARLRTIRAGRPAVRPRATRRSAQAVARARASCASACPRSPTPRPADSDRRRNEDPDVRILFIGDIVGRPGRELVRRGLGPLVEHHQHRSRDRQRRECRRRLRHHARDRRPAPRMRASTS